VQDQQSYLLSHLNLPQPGVPGPRIISNQEQGGPVIPPGTGFSFRRLLRLAGLRRRYSNPPPHGADKLTQVQLYCDRRSVGQFVLVSDTHPWPLAIFLLLSDICGLHVEGRPSWREDGPVIYSYNSLSLSGPSPEELMATSYCLIWDSPKLEGHVPVFTSPMNRVAQLYFPALGSLFVAFYDSQGYRGGILIHLHTGLTNWSWSSSQLCDRRSVGQFFLVLGLPLGLMTKF
jgi:hypothetical protein